MTCCEPVLAVANYISYLKGSLAVASADIPRQGVRRSERGQVGEQGVGVDGSAQRICARLLREQIMRHLSLGRKNRATKQRL